MNHEEECRRKRKLKWEKEGGKEEEKMWKGEEGRRMGKGKRKKTKEIVNGQGGGRVEKGEYEMSIKRYLEG